MPGPPLLPGPCEGVGARPRPAPKRGTDGPKLLPAGTDSSKEEGHPPHPRGSVQSNGGRHTPELYQCRKGENPPPPRTGREGGFSTPPGLPHCIEGGGGVSPTPPGRVRCRRGGKPRPASGWGRHRAVPLPTAIPSAPPTCVRYRCCPRRSAAEPQARTCAPGGLSTPPRSGPRPSCVLASEAGPPPGRHLM